MHGAELVNWLSNQPPRISAGTARVIAEAVRETAATRAELIPSARSAGLLGNVLLASHPSGDVARGLTAAEGRPVYTQLPNGRIEHSAGPVMLWEPASVDPMRKIKIDEVR